MMFGEFSNLDVACVNGNLGPVAFFKIHRLLCATGPRKTFENRALQISNERFGGQIRRSNIESV